MKQATAKTSSNTPPQKIVVIDDVDDYRGMIAVTLKMMGYSIIEAANGSDGLAAVKMHHPDLVLCDVNMPTMDGHTLLSALKQEPQYASIPFIFMTDNSTKSDMRLGMGLGADDYLTKPFTSAELITAIETRLNRRKSLKKYYESQYNDFTSSIVKSLPHEFRTPLNAILGFAQFLKEEDDLPSEEVKEIGALIHKSGERLHHLLENMLLFGQLQLWIDDHNTVAAMRRESLTLLRQVIRSAAEHEAVIQNRTDAITVEVKDSPVQISLLHLTKIMEEIIDNALKFSESGTKISITSEENDTEVLILVKDEGRGMSPEQIGKITAFQQFERRYHEQQGAGLGLTIAKTLTELYGGSLTIESTEKISTTVKIKLMKARKA